VSDGASAQANGSHSGTAVPVAAKGAEGCPHCGAEMAGDQRYCLKCGQRRGEPRLPFMDAVVFMESMRQPPAGIAASAEEQKPAAKGPRFSPNSALVAGVATLVLAMGVGVMIGRSGSPSSNTAAPAPQVIRVGGGPETAEAATAPTEPGKAGKAKGGSNTKAKAKAKGETGASGTTKAAEEVLKPAGDVKLPAPTTQVGGKCEKGTAGCTDSGEFNGSFFGEE
jgi:hypothetical protein